VSFKRATKTGIRWRFPSLCQLDRLRLKYYYHGTLTARKFAVMASMSLKRIFGG
jgi:hypothetical protein